MLDGYTYRINKEQPVACPKDIKRFFVTPEESGQICMLATYLGQSGNIFFPKFSFENDQIFFKEITKKYFSFLGYELVECENENDARNFEFKNKKFPVLFFESDTSGEKKYEEFYTENEKIDIESYESLGFIIKDLVTLNLDELISDFDKLFDKEKLNKAQITKLITKYVDDFEHLETNKSLDEKM